MRLSDRPHRDLSRRVPTYLRIVTTTRCPLRCAYCHMEGDPHRHGTPYALPEHLTIQILTLAVRMGVRKFKFLGGEPLVDARLPTFVAHIRGLAPQADISVITSGVARPGLLDAVIAAGLDRVNISIHGFGLEAFDRRGGRLPMHRARAELIARTLDLCRPIKLNYVYSSPADEGDLQSLLEWAVTRPCVVNVLDDLGDAEASHQTVESLLVRLRGLPAKRVQVPDPHSLPTTHWIWSDGLRVEVKDRRLGDLAPWPACAGCPARARCREGIFALRLTHTGWLRPCMDRPGLGVDLVAALRSGDADAAWLRVGQQAHA